MKTLFLSIFLLFCTSSVYAQKTNTNIGLILGDPTGISGKYWIDDTLAFDFAISWKTGTIGVLNNSNDKNSLTLHSTYLLHDFSIINMKNGKLPGYIGVGATVTLQHSLAVGVRGAAGFDYIFSELPFDVFIELAPTFYLIPSSTFAVGFGLGIRYRF